MKTILSVDGGGMKGYIPCSLLVELETRTGKSCHDLFDMFAGTSIGGVMACLFASGKTATDSLKFFTEDGPEIFSNTQFWGRGGFIEPRYKADTIEAKLQALLGTIKLSDLQKALVTVGFDLMAYAPCFFKTPAPDVDYLLWQVARATSAAQTYFPACDLGDKLVWDGGVVANNPTACAVAEANKIWPGEPLRILSLGCGQAARKSDPKNLINAGLLRAGIETLSVLFDANDELADYILKHLMPNGYYRISPKLSKTLPIDGASADNIADLKAAADQGIKDGSDTLNRFIAYTA